MAGSININISTYYNMDFQSNYNQNGLFGPCFQIVLFIYNDNSLNMKLRICTLIAVSCAALSGTAQNEKLTEYVNPLVGTDGYGNVYPGAQIPFGGIQISPDTGC